MGSNRIFGFGRIDQAIEDSSEIVPAKILKIETPLRRGFFFARHKSTRQYSTRVPYMGTNSFCKLLIFLRLTALFH